MCVCATRNAWEEITSALRSEKGKRSEKAMSMETLMGISLIYNVNNEFCMAGVQ